MTNDPLVAGPGVGNAATPGGVAELVSSAVRLITEHPGLLLEHAQAHAELLSLEMAAVTARLKRETLWWAAALCGGFTAATLAGVALMLWHTRVLPLATVGEAPAVGLALASPWLLAGIPGAALLLAAVCAAGGLGTFAAPVPPQSGLLARLKSDLACLRMTPR